MIGRVFNGQYRDGKKNGVGVVRDWKINLRKAEDLRNQETPAEKVLWSKLCRKQLGVKFRRQHPIHSYIVDFYCHSAKLVIEIDGPIHDTKESQTNDKVRTQGLQEFAIEVVRFTNDEVLKNVDKVVKKIRDRITAKPKDKTLADWILLKFPI